MPQKRKPQTGGHQSIALLWSWYRCSVDYWVVKSSYLVRVPTSTTVAVTRYLALETDYRVGCLLEWAMNNHARIGYSVSFRISAEIFLSSPRGPQIFSNSLQLYQNTVQPFSRSNALRQLALRQYNSNQRPGWSLWSSQQRTSSRHDIECQSWRWFWKSGWAYIKFSFMFCSDVSSASEVRGEQAKYESLYDIVEMNVLFPLREIDRDTWVPIAEWSPIDLHYHYKISNITLHSWSTMMEPWISFCTFIFWGAVAAMSIDSAVLLFVRNPSACIPRLLQFAHIFG